MSGLHRSCRCAELSKADVGKEVTVMGWVQTEKQRWNYFC